MLENIPILGTCTYCGKYGEVTNDHILPQCLWPGRVPKEAPQIPACRICNNVWKSEYDMYLRDMLVNDLACAKNPLAQKVRAKFYRSAGKNQSIMARDLVARGELVGLEEPSGRVSGFAVTLPDGVTRNQTILPLIVRGLHQHYLGTPFPQDVTFEVGRVIERRRMEAILQDMWANGGSLRKIRNGDVFECYFAPRRDEPYFEVWVLNFYKCIRYLMSIKHSK